MFNLRNLIFLLESLKYMFQINVCGLITWVLVINILLALKWNVLSKPNVNRKYVAVSLLFLIYPLMNLYSGSLMTRVLFDKHSVWPSVLFLYNFGVHILISIYLVKHYKNSLWFAISLILFSTWFGLFINFIVGFTLGI